MSAPITVRVDLLGFYPTVESVGAQIVLLVAVLLVWMAPRSLISRLRPQVGRGRAGGHSSAIVSSACPERPAISISSVTCATSNSSCRISLTCRLMSSIALKSLS